LLDLAGPVSQQSPLPWSNRDVSIQEKSNGKHQISLAVAQLFHNYSNP